ncbi:hypothetical protein TRICHSKD4_1640 [Roseibium sp. TrichSKD4]|nr:hypothetical protein TRICHSKD4_1640 [Roseibium sp. TrichSKD4]
MDQSAPKRHPLTQQNWGGRITARNEGVNSKIKRSTEQNF